MSQFNTIKYTVQAMGEHLLEGYPDADKEYFETVLTVLTQFSYNAGVKQAMQDLNDEIPSMDEELL